MTGKKQIHQRYSMPISHRFLSTPNKCFRAYFYLRPFETHHIQLFKSGTFLKVAAAGWACCVVSVKDTSQALSRTGSYPQGGAR